MKNYYRPLPNNLTIINSPIEGLGLFATIEIKSDTCLGLTHVYHSEFENNYIRTPLGGFINYSKTPNCRVDNLKDKNLYLWTITDINKGEELTLKYNLYNPNK